MKSAITFTESEREAQRSDRHGRCSEDLSAFSVKARAPVEPDGAADLQGSRFSIAAEPKLYSGTGAGLTAAVNYLAGAKENRLVRITGGCLYLEPEKALLIQDVLGEVLEEFRDCMILGGGTVARHSQQPARMLPGVAEIAALAEERGGAGRILGVIPGADLAQFEQTAGRVRVARDTFRQQDWDIELHPQLRNALISEIITAYPWDSEWQKCIELLGAVDQQRRLAGGVIFAFDGGIGTANELKAWQRLLRDDARLHMVLISGGDPERTTDRWIHHPAWQQGLANLHILPPDAKAILAALRSAGVTPQAYETSSFCA